MIKISPKIYIVNIAPQLTGDPVAIKKVSEAANVEILNNAKIQKIYGDSFARGIKVQRQGKILDLKLEFILIAGNTLKYL